MPDTLVRYCIALSRWAGSDAWSPLAVNGRIVVFDTLRMAQDFLPTLAWSRDYRWSADKETLTFVPPVLTGEAINQVCIMTGYDPFDVPVSILTNCSKNAVRSEGKGRAWRSHVMWHEVREGLQESQRRVDADRVETFLEEHPEVGYA